MSESHLNANRPPAPRAHNRAAVARSAEAWAPAQRDARVTAYDDLWYQGRPQRP